MLETGKGLQRAWESGDWAGFFDTAVDIFNQNYNPLYTAGEHGYYAYNSKKAQDWRGTFRHGTIAVIIGVLTVVTTAKGVAGAAKKGGTGNGSIERVPTTRNGHLAGQPHPKSGVPFDAKGYPDFTKMGVVRAEVKISPTGSRAGDFRAANEAAGLSRTPEGYTWHHHQDGITMQLVPKDVHAQTGHTGGFAIGGHKK